MKRRLLLVSGLALGAMASASGTALALPTCAQLNTDPANGLQDNPIITIHTTTKVAAAGGNAAYCRVDFTVSERGGTAAGYAPGQNQAVGLRVGLPLNSADGGTGGTVDGAWNGKVRNIGGGGLVGAVGAVTTATNARYVGSSTDSGHTTAENPGFGVIQASHELNVGKIQDFFSESLRLQYQWALRLASTYYGTPATRNYWDGCSTGGRQGLVLATKYGNDFDGFLVGAPHTNHTRTSSTSAWRQWVNKDVAGGTVTDAKLQATVNRFISECDAQDGVVDGLLTDPRMCHVSATLNICGQPGAPTGNTCLTPAEAKAIDIVYNGAVNDKGRRVFVQPGMASSMSMVVGSNVGGTSDGDGVGNNGVFGWAMKDMTYDYRTHPLSEWDDIHELSSNVVGDLVNMSSPNLDLVKNRGGKILMWQGGSDFGIPWMQNVYYYNRVIDYYGGLANVTDWYRHFIAPGVGHCGGGVGPQPVNLFDAMVAWVENGAAPDALLSSNGSGAALRTRPLCMWPTKAIYNGTGSTNDAANFHCGGNMETQTTQCNNLFVQYKHETGTAMETSPQASCNFNGPSILGVRPPS
jgi:hypothetical protein